MRVRRKLWRLRVHRMGKREFMFKVGISDDTNKLLTYALRVANGSFASSSWTLKDNDVIAVLYYGSTLKFAVNGKEYPKAFHNLPFNRPYALTVQLYDCMEIELLL